MGFFLFSMVSTEIDQTVLFDSHPYQNFLKNAEIVSENFNGRWYYNTEPL